MGHHVTFLIQMALNLKAVPMHSGCVINYETIVRGMCGISLYMFVQFLQSQNAETSKNYVNIWMR